MTQRCLSEAFHPKWANPLASRRASTADPAGPPAAAAGAAAARGAPRGAEGGASAREKAKKMGHGRGDQAHGEYELSNISNIEYIVPGCKNRRTHMNMNESETYDLTLYVY